MYFFQKGNIKRAYAFYSIIVTRKNAFATLLLALEETNQSGALEILKENENVTQNRSLPKDFSEVPSYVTSFLSNKEQHVLVVISIDTKLTLKRITQTVSSWQQFNSYNEICENFPAFDKSSNDFLCVHECKENFWDIFSALKRIKTKFVIIINKLNANDDFEGKLADRNACIEHDEIKIKDFTPKFRYHIVGNVQKYLRLSTYNINQALQKVDSSTLVQFINGESPVLFKDFVPKRPANYFARSVMCRQTKNKQNCDGNQDCPASSQYVIKEEDFINDMTSFNVDEIHHVCLSDTPGMGKSMLLANIARRLSSNRLYGFVTFVTLSNLIPVIKKELKETNNREEAIFSGFCEYACTSVGSIFVKINQSFLTEILLDGFDELNHDDEELGYECLKTIKHLFPNARLWVTTRPHKSQKLEQELNVQVYNIQAFCESDQIEFLASYWCTNCASLNEKELKSFAKLCLSDIKSIIRAQEQDIAGILLQCWLIAVWFQDEAKEFSSSGPHTDGSNLRKGVKHMIELYQNLVEKKFDIFFTQYQSSNIKTVYPPILEKSFFAYNAPTNYEDFAFNFFCKWYYREKTAPLTRKDLTNLHIYNSLKIVSQNLAKILEPNLHLTGILQENVIVNCGLMELKMSTLTFVHRTFADYFLAILFIECVENKYNDDIRSLVTTELLRTQKKIINLRKMEVDSCEFKHEVVCYFVDAMLKTKLESSKKLCIVSQCDPQDLRNIAKSCASGDFKNMFCSIFSANKSSKDIFDNQLAKELMVISVFGGCSKMFTEIRNLNCFIGAKLADTNNCDYSLLHSAVFGSEYETIENLWTHEDFSDLVKNDETRFKHLLHMCLSDTIDVNDKVLNEKIKILSYLSTIADYLLLSKNENDQIILQRDDVHIILLKEFINILSSREASLERFFNMNHVLPTDILYMFSECVILPPTQIITCRKYLFSNYDCTTVKHSVKLISKLNKDFNNDKNLQSMHLDDFEYVY